MKTTAIPSSTVTMRTTGQRRKGRNSSLRRSILAASIATLAVLGGASLQAQTWQGTTSDFNTGSNWSGGSAPGSGGTGTFANTGLTSLTFSAQTTPGALQFNAGAPQYTLTSDSIAHGVELTGAGVIDNSGNAPILASTGGGTFQFVNSASAGDATLTSSGAFLQFFDTSSAAGAKVQLGTGGILTVENDTTLSVGSLSGTSGSDVVFERFPSAGPLTLTVGALNSTTTFAGTIGQQGGTVGSLDKVGTGTLTLSSASSYTGGTTVDGGTLAISNSSALGTGGVTLAPGTTLALEGVSITNNVAVSGDPNISVTGANSMATITGTGTVNILGTSGSATTDVLTLTAANSYTAATVVGDGTTADAVTLEGGIAGAFSASSATTVTANSVLDIGGFNQTVASIAGAGTVTDSGAAATFTVANSSADSFGGTITGANLSLTAAGTATLGLTSANTYGGSTTINTGATLADGITNALPTGTALTANGTLDLAGFGQQVASVTGTGSVTDSGAAATFTVANSSADTFGGTITGANLSLTAAGTATLTLTQANTYGGSTTINTGATIADGIANALPTGTALTANGTLDLAGFSQQVASVTGTGSVTDSGGAATFTVANSSADTFGGTITGANLSLTAAGMATLTLTSANTYGGSTTINTGATIADGIANALPTGTALTANGTLDLAGFGQQVASVTGTGSVTDSGAAATFTVANSSADTFGGTITGANLSLTAAGTATLTLTQANTYGGSTTINTGATIADGIANALPTGTALTANGTLDLAGFGQQVASVTGTGSVTDSGAAATFTVANSGADSFGGSFTGANFALSKSGGGTLTLTGASTYGGATTVNAGTLLVNNTTGSGTGTGGVEIKSSATLGGSGAISGPVTLDTGGTIAPSTGTPGVAGTTLHTGPLTWNPGSALNLQLGATGDQLVINGALTGNGNGLLLNITDAGINHSNYILATFNSTNTTLANFNLTLPAGYSAAFFETPSELGLDLFVAASGRIIQNSGPVFTPTFADFTVIGPVITGGPNDNNTIHTLTFTPGSSLTIFNTLYVTQGPVILVGGSSITLDGSLSVSQLQMLFGSLLNGNGSILGNLFNAGVVSPGHSPGRIGVSGNYTQAPTGLLRIEIGGTDLSQHDLLSVGGKANLNGTLQLVQLNGFTLKRNQSVTFLTANDGVSGKFAAVDNGFASDTILQPTVVYGSTSVALEALQGSFAALPGLTPNQKAVGQALDSLPTNSSRTNSLLDYLDYRALNKLPGDLDRIAPEELTSVYTLGVSLATEQSLNVQRRTDDIRSGSSGFNAANLALNGDNPSFSGGFRTGVAGPNGNEIRGDDGKEMKETKEVAPADNRWGVFLSGTGEWVSVGNTENARGYDLESGGFTLGVDYKVTPNLAIGLAAGYTGTTADLTDGGRIWVNGGQLGLYATFFQNEQAAPAPTMSKDSSKEAPAPAPSVAKGFYADVAVFGGYNSYDTRRSALQGEARGDTDGGELNVLFGTGYDFKSGGLTFGPTATFNYTYIGTNDFTEHGSLAPLNVHGGQGESLRTALGFKASFDWKVGGIVIKPELRAAWQHEYGDAAYAMDSSFASGAGNSFLVNGPKLGRDSALLGAGFAIQLNERCATYFYYDGELGRTNYQSNSVTGGFRIAF